jgi:hypothetical protein
VGTTIARYYVLEMVKYTLGDNLYGQLGHGDNDDRLLPTLVQALDDISIIQIQLGIPLL